ncbi:hypothetical protein CIG75_17235 [Tumebacillus algifaecis]|uniref:Uncharacterized protein n=1 Tax=Tumebacillus algifaecis TaxID=1214604 RepID=A0A223D4U2_9BACL|nr:Ger(x)C family spore germination protein [Tumebacillus algifaecis]ASS76530.1 hypothetical protein CIG75_17235 [Tumebacillus algifaecis]
MKRKVKTSWLPLGLLLCWLPMLVGCWDVKDINHRSLPAAMAIDISDKGTYEVWVKIPKIGGKTSSEYIVTYAQNPSLSKAIDTISANLDRTVDLLHIKMIFISKKVCIRGTSEVVDYAIRTREIGNKSKLAIVTGDMNQFFSSTSKSVSGSTGISYDNFFSTQSGWTPEVVRISLWEAYRGRWSMTQDSVLPVITRGTTTLLTLKGGAYMREGKLTGTLNLNETFTYNVFKGDFRGGIVQFFESGAVRILEANVDKKVKIIGDRPILDTRFKLTVTVLERKGNATDETLIKDIQQMFTKTFLDTLAQAQSDRTDIFAIGQLFRSKYSFSQLQKWKDELYPQLKANIKVDVIIRNRGNLRN